MAVSLHFVLASSFETRPSGAPQDEDLILMVRSEAELRVSNHEATDQ
jgi:hypothetical protein